MKSTKAHFRLTENDCKVLIAAQPDFRMSVNEIAKKARLRDYTVSHSLKRLRENKIISPYLLTNLHAIGLTDYCVFFNCIGEEKKSRQKIIDHCQRSSRVAYFAELTGTFQFSLSLFCRTVFEVMDFFEELNRLLPRSSFDKNFAIRLNFTQFLGKLFAENISPVSLTRTKVSIEYELDEIDREILAYYSQNAQLPLREIAKKIGISESAVRYRLRDLEEKKVILAFPYLFDAAKVGITSFRILIAAKAMTPSFERTLFNYAKAHPNCVIFVKCMGTWDFELNFDVLNTSLIGAIVEDFYDQFSEHIRHYHTLNELTVFRGHHFPNETGLK